MDIIYVVRMPRRETETMMLKAKVEGISMMESRITRAETM